MAKTRAQRLRRLRELTKLAQKLPKAPPNVPTVQLEPLLLAAVRRGAEQAMAIG